MAIVQSNTTVDGTGSVPVDTLDADPTGTHRKRQVMVIGHPDATLASQYWLPDSHGSGPVALYDAAGNPLLVNPANGSAGTDLLAVAPMEYNGVTWDPRYNGNDSITLLASAARTSVAVGSVQPANNWKGVLISITIASIVTTCSLQVILASGGTNYVFAQAPTALTAVGAYGYAYYPGASGTNVISAGTPNNIQAVYSIPIFGSWTVEVLPANSNSVTYSVVAIPAP